MIHNIIIFTIGSLFIGSIHAGNTQGASNSHKSSHDSLPIEAFLIKLNDVIDNDQENIDDNFVMIDTTNNNTDTNEPRFFITIDPHFREKLEKTIRSIYLGTTNNNTDTNEPRKLVTIDPHFREKLENIIKSTYCSENIVDIKTNGGYREACDLDWTNMYVDTNEQSTPSNLDRTFRKQLNAIIDRKASIALEKYIDYIALQPPNDRSFAEDYYSAKEDGARQYYLNHHYHGSHHKSQKNAARIAHILFKKGDHNHPRNHAKIEQNNEKEQKELFKNNTPQKTITNAPLYNHNVSPITSHSKHIATIAPTTSFNQQLALTCHIIARQLAYVSHNK